MKKTFVYMLVVIFAGGLLLWTGMSQADTITFSGSSGNLAASAVFDFTGTTLTITLTNTSSADVLVPTDVLTGLFFNTTHTLTPVSASLNGSSVFYGSTSNPGDGWGYASSVSAQGENTAISASGAVNGLGHSNFSAASNALQGLGYGILSAGDNSATGNTEVTGHGPLIKNSVLFTLTAASGFALSELGNGVVFQYGTALSDTHYGSNTPVPEPSTMLLLGSGLLGLIGFRNRFRK
jgi:hypothetical protein